MNDFFNTLGIEATKEEKEIKKAYRDKLHTVNPEDDPNGFKILREAYEEALKYARQKETRRRKGCHQLKILFFAVNSFIMIFIGELMSRSGRVFFQKISVSV